MNVINYIHVVLIILFEAVIIRQDLMKYSHIIQLVTKYSAFNAYFSHEWSNDMQTVSSIIWLYIPLSISRLLNVIPLMFPGFDVYSMVLKTSDEK